MRVTMEDVARLANVSRTTVSLVLNGQASGIPPATRQRVIQAARELGYVRDRLRSALQTGRINALGVVFRNQVEWSLYHPTRESQEQMVAGLGGLLAGASEAGVSITLFPEHGTGVPLAEELADRRVDGVLLIAPAPGEGLPERLAELAVPYVVVAAREGQYWVDADHEFGAQQAARHLVGLGHRRLGLVSPHEETHATGVRGAAFLAELEELGMRSGTVGITFDRSHDEAAEKELAKLLTSSRRPTAVFAVNDELAAVVIGVVRRLGGTVPQQLSVVGFDDSPLAVRLDPRLTTVEMPLFEMMRRAILALAHLTRGRPPGEHQQALPTRLVIRDSTAPPG